VNTTVNDIVASSAATGRIQMTEPVRAALNGLKDFLFVTVYQGSAAKAEVGKAQRLLITLFAYFIDHPGEIGEEARRLIDEGRSTIPRAACDFLAGMTDRFAIRAGEQLFVPRTWASL
jgi:dGTPase